MFVLTLNPNFFNRAGTVRESMKFFSHFWNLLPLRAAGSHLLTSLLVLPGLLLGAEEPGAGDKGTVITSERLELETLETGNRFVFLGEVRVIGENLDLRSDRLTVITVTGEEGGEGEIIDPSRIETIVAEGNVVIHLAPDDRWVEAGVATLFPGERKVVLKGSPVVRDARGEVSGHRITLFEGERQALVEGGEDGPSRVVLPGVRTMGNGQAALANDGEEADE